MIMSGWILPDFYEVKCKSCSTFNGHIEVVKRYLDNLKLKDLYLYNKIIDEFHKLKYSPASIGLDDFSVIKLGWMKINNDPINIFFYANKDLEWLAKKYILLGYSPVILEKKLPLIEVNIPSHKLV